MNRSDFEKNIINEYGVTCDHPFSKYPDFAVFRHNENKKWFAVTMTVPLSKLVPNGMGNVDIVNLKCPTRILDWALKQEGIFPAYHMNKKHWISVILDDKGNDDDLLWLLQLSHKYTLYKSIKKQQL